VHSTFSDGSGTVEENVRAAHRLGLNRVGLVDHVRRSTPWVPDFVRGVATLNARVGLDVECCVEAKILDQAGNLDLPGDLTGVHRVLAADHQFPGPSGPIHPSVVRDALRQGQAAASGVVAGLVGATIAAMEQRAGLLLAHLFSLLPKVGLDEGDVRDDQLERLADAARRSGAAVEISERWRCPTPRVASVFLGAGVPVLAGTDAHAPHLIGKYDYVTAVFRSLGGTD
jgi:putative hydrolase